MTRTLGYVLDSHTRGGEYTEYLCGQISITNRPVVYNRTVRDRGFDKLAKKLAVYGLAGVERVLHIGCTTPTLPWRVMDALGSPEKWLDTEEAKRMLFYRRFDYSNKHEAIEQQQKIYEETGWSEGDSTTRIRNFS